MDRYQYKERDYAQAILEKGFITSYVARELRVLVKYFKELGYKPSERKNKIVKFCKKHLPDYERETHFKMIDAVCNHGANKKNVIVQVDEITVYKNEIDYINNLDLSTDEKKIIFSLLCLNKISKELHIALGNEDANPNNYFGSSQEYKFLSATSKVNLKNNKVIHNIIGTLALKNLVEIAVKGKIKLKFIGEIHGISEEAIKIHTFDNIGLYYDEYMSLRKVKRCESCNSPVVVRSNKRYCEPCRKDLRLKYLAEKQKEFREKKK